jgi:hypothetical protein
MRFNPLLAGFDDRSAKAIGDAYDTIAQNLKNLNGTPYFETMKEAIAARVIQIASRSDGLDAGELADETLRSFASDLPKRR